MVADLALARPPDVAPQGAMEPVAHRVVDRRDETADVTTLTLVPVSGAPMTYRCGQFNMLTAFGVGEVAISVSSAPHETGSLRHTVRDVGPVTRALCRTRVGDVVGVRGPFGRHWRIGDEGGPGDGDGDVVVVAGGIGIAPLRGAVYELSARARSTGGRVSVIVGAREPGQIIFDEDLRVWSHNGATVTVTVDVAGPGWSGHVGTVTALLGETGLDLSRASALICGPEIMMRFTAAALIDRGLDPARILVALERNMQCGIGWCGHCQLGGLLLCRDGPVLPYAGAVSHLLTERER